MGICSGISTKWLFIHCFQIELKFRSVDFCGRRKTGEPGEKPSEQGREPTTNSAHMWRRVRESNPGHIGGRRVLSLLHHPCSPYDCSTSHSWHRFGLQWWRFHAKEKTWEVKLPHWWRFHAKEKKSEVKIPRLITFWVKGRHNKYYYLSIYYLAGREKYRAHPRRWSADRF